MKKILTLLSLFLALVVTAQIYPVGHISVNFKDASRSGGFSISGGSTFPASGTGRTIGTEVYYPATSAGDNTPSATGQFPVVVFGHGFVMTWDAYTTLKDSLVRNGYIVAFARTEGGIPPSHLDFGKDLAFIASQIQAMNTTSGNVLYTHVTDRTAIGGHSMGGGATFLSDAYAGVTVKCYFTFSAAETNPSAVTAAASTTRPHLVFSGTYDCVAPPASNSQLMYDALNSTCKTFVNLTKGYHCTFADNNFNCGFGEGTCITAGGLTGAVQQQLVRRYLNPYLDYYLKGVCPAFTKFQALLDTTTTATVQRSCTVTVPENASISGPSYFCHGDSANLTALPAGFQYQWNNSATVSSIYVNQAGTYSLVVGNGTCALPPVSTTVAENFAPAPLSAITAADTVCSGISNIAISVTSDPAVTTYNWTLPAGWNISSGANTASIEATSGSSGGTLSLTAENVCGTAGPVTKTITVVPSTLGAPGAITGPLTICAGTSATYEISTVSGASAYIWTFPAGWSATSVTDSNAIVVTASATSGAVTVKAENTCGLSIPASLQLTAEDVPAGGAVTGNNVFCITTNGDQTFTLNPAPASGTITWAYPNNWMLVSGQGTSTVVVNPNNSADTLKASVSNNCGSTVFIPLAITFIDTPQVSLSITNTTITAASATSGTWQWYLNGTLLPNETAASITTTQSGNYTAVLNPGNDCSGSATINYLYESIGNVAALPFSFTNPANESLQLFVPGHTQANLSIFDAQGRLVWQQQLHAERSTVNVQALSTGVYVLQVSSGTQSSSNKLVITR